MSRFTFRGQSIWHFASMNADVHQRSNMLRRISSWRKVFAVFLGRPLAPSLYTPHPHSHQHISDNCYGHHGRCPCKKYSVRCKNFSRLNTKTAYILLFRDIFESLGVFLVYFSGVKCWIWKCCLCKSNDKYQVCSCTRLDICVGTSTVKIGSSVDSSGRLAEITSTSLHPAQPSCDMHHNL